MKLQYLHIILLGVLFFCFSCRKNREVAKYDGEYTITGKVIDEITGKGISQANVGVIERDRDATSHFGGKTVAFDKTDPGGNFTLTFDANTEKYNYELTANALTYFTKTSGDDITFTKNGSRTQNITLTPHGYLTFLIRGILGGNRISISAGGGGISFYQGIDTFLTYYVSPKTDSHSAYWVYFQDTSKNYNESIVLPPPPPYDTIYYLIEF